MKNKACVYFLAFVAVLFFIGKASAQKVFLPHYTTKEGLPSNQCYYTLQDKKGFLWVATDAGVSRFDGAIFENFTVEDGLPDNQIVQLHEDSKGRLWFLSLNGQLSFFYNGKIYNKDNFKPLANLNFTGVVVSFFEDSKNRLWLGTNNNVIGMWDGKTTLKFSGQRKSTNHQNSFIYEDGQQQIRTISVFGNLLFQKNKFVATRSNIVPLSHKTISQGLNKEIYYLDKNGLNVVDKHYKYTKLYSLNKTVLNNGVGYIYVDTAAVWLSSATGVTIIDNRGRMKTLLKGVTVSNLIKDNVGNMWFATQNGLYKMPQQNDQLHTYQPGNKTEHNFKSIIKDAEERLWLGGNNGSIHILSPKSRKSTTIKLADTTKFNLIKQLAIDKKNNKIYFAADYGVGVVSATYPAIKDFNFLKETNNHTFVVKSFAIYSTQKLSLSMSSGVAIINDREKLSFSSYNYKEGEDFFANRSYRVFYDRDQNLWFSNINGLSQFGNHKLTAHYKYHSLLTKRINDIVQLPNGAMALATDGYGIVLIKDGKITSLFNRKNGLHNNIVNKLFVKGDVLWAISNNGINCIKLNTLKPKITAFDDINSMLAGNLNDIYVTNDTAYLATDNGLIYFAPSHSMQRIKAPAVYITGILHKGKQLDLGQKTFTLKPNDQEITINYGAVDFKNKNITYRYKLKSTNNWVETKNRKLALSSLSAGTYDFVISAKNQNSGWGEPASIKLILLEKFYQTWWFITLMLLAGAYLVYSVTVKITKNKKNKEQEELLLKHKILMLEQKALQAMMNPHFVFNVMNSIQHYINTQNTTSANKLLTGFARLIRKNLEICTQSYISLADEINYLALYLSLEKNRFGDKLTYAIDVAEEIDVDDTEIPSMLLQPYIENAIWHGIMPKETGGKVTITIDQENEETLLIKIIDDGVGIENALSVKKGDHQSQGMKLISDRIHLLNQIEPKPIHLKIAQNGKSGTTISISIPINQ